MQCPQLEAACDTLKALLAEKQPPWPPRTIEDRRWHRAHEHAQTSAQQSATEAYATELLPAILGGEWQPARSPDWVGDLIRYPGRPRIGCPPIDTHEMFDHPIVFRRKGYKGPLTWRIAAIVGRPYRVIDSVGAFTPEAAHGARWLAEKQGVGYWVRRDLSAWYPGWTNSSSPRRNYCTSTPPRSGFSR